MPAVRTRRIIDETGAQAVLDAAERKALEQGSRVVMAVVDPWGELVAYRRTKDAQIASSRVALDKARTAAIFIRPSREIEEQVTNGRLGALALSFGALYPQFGSENAAQMTTLFSATLGGPLVKTAAFSYGVRKAIRGDGSRRRAKRSA